jgi:hypothetical protein
MPFDNDNIFAAEGNGLLAMRIKCKDKKRYLPTMIGRERCKPFLEKLEGRYHSDFSYFGFRSAKLHHPALTFPE